VRLGGERAWLLIGVVAILAGASSGDAMAQRAWITNQGDDTVSVIDTEISQVIATIPVGHKPAGVAVPYVTNPESHDLSVIDADRLRVVATVKLGQGPLGIDVDHAGRRLYIADWYANIVTVLDTATLSRVIDVPVGKAPSGVIAGNKFILVANRDSDSVSVIDPHTNQVTTTIAVGSRPFGLSMDRQERRAYIADVGSDDLAVVDLEAMKTIARIKVGAMPYVTTVSRDGALAFATNQHDNTVSVVDTATLAVIKTLPVGDYPEGIMAHPDGKRILVAGWFSNTVSVIDLATMTVSDTIATGESSRAFGRFIAEKR
jgi:YVTN family beta-propeller protein